MEKTIISLLMGILVLSILMVFQPMIMGSFLDQLPTYLVRDPVTTKIILFIIFYGVPILIFILTLITLIIVFRKIKT